MQLLQSRIHPRQGGCRDTVRCHLLPGVRGGPEDVDRPANAHDNSDQDLLLADGVLRIPGLRDMEFLILC